MKNIFVKIIIGVLIALSIFSILYMSHQKSNKQNFINECIYCHSHNISHQKPKYKYLENYVIPMTTVSHDTSFRGSGAISKPIAHYDVEYHCDNCNKSFNSELEIDILVKENQNKFKIEYKE